jgi:hypothetical protein
MANALLGAMAILFGVCFFCLAHEVAAGTERFSARLGYRLSQSRMRLNRIAFRLAALGLIVFGLLAMVGIIRFNLTRP